jgi:two-component system phosphate regulon response regulator PhoB
MSDRPGKILIVDDNQETSRLLSARLRREGYSVLWSKEGRGGLELAIASKPDLIVLETVLPVLSGIDVLRYLRHFPETRRIPVIVLSARHDEDNRIRAFELGADDYVRKPFSARESVLRIRAVLRRVSGAPPGDWFFQCDGIVLDTLRHAAAVNDKPLRLTLTEFSLLAFLLQNRGQVMSREVLTQQICGLHRDGASRTVDTHIQRLRQKLGDEAECLQTIRSVGYKLDSVRGGNGAQPRG